MEKYAHRRNAILGIIKAYYNIVKTRLATGISMQLQWGSLIFDQYKGAIINNSGFFSILLLKMALAYHQIKWLITCLYQNLNLVR